MRSARPPEHVHRRRRGHAEPTSPTPRPSTSRRASTSRSATTACTTAATACSSARPTRTSRATSWSRATAIYDNGNVGSIFEHNIYTEALGITFQFNYFGPLKAGARRQQPEGPLGRAGRPLQLDRGRKPPARPGRDRQPDDSERPALSRHVRLRQRADRDRRGGQQADHPLRRRQRHHANYRKGTLYFYNNTLVSYSHRTARRCSACRPTTSTPTRATTSSTSRPPASTLSLLDDTGILDLTHNWFKPGRVGDLRHVDRRDQRRRHINAWASSPGFRDEAGAGLPARGRFGGSQRRHRASGGASAGTGDRLRVREAPGRARRAPNDGVFDLGAFELTDGQVPNLADSDEQLAGGTGGCAGHTEP